MKTGLKFLVGVLVLISISVQSNAQFKLGLKEGLNLGTQSELGLLWRINETKLGHTLGLLGEYRLNNYFIVQSEINYQENGGVQKLNFEGRYRSIISEYSYYNIPLILKFDINDETLKSRNMSLSLYTGGYYSYLKEAQMEIKNENQIKDLSNSSEYSDFGSLLGLEISYNLKSSSELFVDLRYSMGFSEVNTLNSDIRNKLVGISFGYKF
jgi:hypothetical protein